jgi:hypothetical protein
MKYFLAWVFDCYRKPWAYHSLINNRSLLIQTFDSYSVVSIISLSNSYLLYQFLSSESKLPNPTFLESRAEIPFKGGSLSHPKISILECEPFSQKKLKFSKGFHLFSFKMILFEFIFNLKRVYKVKRFLWCSKFIDLNCENFQTNYLF